MKYRGVSFRSGYHDYVIRKGGLQVFPRLVASEHRIVGEKQSLPSGLKELDLLLGGGIERGTSTLISGTTGTGKSTLTAQFVHAAAARGEKSLMVIFDESRNTLLRRVDQLNINLRPHIESGTVAIAKIDPGELSPGEIIFRIREAVEKDGVSIVVIDGLNGYLHAVPGEDYLTTHLHELLTYLGQKGVATLLVTGYHGFGEFTLTATKGGMGKLQSMQCSISIYAML